MSRVSAQDAAMDADRFDRLAKSLVFSETCLARGASRPRLAAIAGAALGRREALKVAAGLVLGAAMRVLGSGDVVEAVDVDDAHCPAPGGESGPYGPQRSAQTFTAKHTGLLTQAVVQRASGGVGVLN